MLPHDQKPWAKSLARAVICVTILGLALLAYYLKTHNSLHIPEIVGIFLLFLTIVPPNLAIIYPWLIPANHHANHDTGKSTTVR
jgi:hypothetical protein